MNKPAHHRPAPGLLAAGCLIGLSLAMPARAANEDLLKPLPPALQELYTGSTDNLKPSAYDDFKLPPKPWKWCHSESYQGNPWRVAVTKELQRLVDGYKAKGLISSFEVSNSNNDASQQIAQIRAFIDKKCTIITSIAGSSTGLNDAIEAAYKAGIPFVTQTGSVTSPYAINVDQNYVRWGADMAQAIVDELGNKGNVLMVAGIPGQPIDALERQGANSVFSKSGVKIVRTVNGNWTANVTKSVVLQALATSPQKIDAVWTSGSEVRVIAEDFAQAHRPQPLITGSLTGDMLGYWKEHPDLRFSGTALGPSWMAQTLFRVGVRILEGQQPRVGTMMTPLPVVKQADLGKWYRSCMTPASTSIFPIAPSDPMPDSLMDAYFRKPAPVEGYSYADTPDPCAAQ
ncbi:substrate-binding domain-containing protein [Labrys monachus]|uniref:Ribose transport system substrate-binding protein n=1 Tax=Labrys monachus TaxID=217067 RepID=A0ABU0FK84_9HYPH|nr:substrate-binding domain-containing protein [Labrys monachus]MDQ0394757.1 ribose transport system substrate-binding protein [Labrys monachus]